MTTIIAMMMLVGPSVAQRDNLKIDTAKLPRGVSAGAVRTAYRRVAEADQAAMAKEDQSVQSRAEAIGKALASERQVLARTTDTNPTFKFFMEQAARINSANFRGNRKASMNTLYTTNKELVEQVFNQATTGRDLSGTIKRNSSPSMVISKDLTGVFVKPKKEEPDPIPTEHKFEAPYAIVDSSVDLNGPGLKSGSADVTTSNATMSLSAAASGVYGLAKALGRAGVILTPPANAKVVTITVYYEYTWEGNTWALGGFGECGLYTSMYIEPLVNPPQPARKTVEYEKNFSVLLNWSSAQNTATGFETLSFAIPANAGDLVAMTSVYVTTLGMTGGSADATATFKVKSIEASYTF